VRFSGNAPKRLSRPVNALDSTTITAGVAEVHTFLGDNGRAIEMLDGLLSRPSYIAAGDLKINPVLNPLRFQKLCDEKQP